MNMAKDISLENAIESQMLFGKHVVESYVEMADDPTNISSNIPLTINNEKYDISLRKVSEQPIKPTAFISVSHDDFIDVHETNDLELEAEYTLPVYSEKDLKRSGISIRGGNNVVEK